VNRCGLIVVDNPEIILIDRVGTKNLLSVYNSILMLQQEKLFDYSDLNRKITARLDRTVMFTNLYITIDMELDLVLEHEILADDG
jgi:hypothetical protein